MKDVSCKAFDLVLAALEPKGITAAQMVEGTSLTVAHIKNKRERVDWAEFAAFMARARPHFTDDEYIEIGRKYLRQPALRFVFVIARMLMSPLDFYRWFSKPREGVGWSENVARQLSVPERFGFAAYLKTKGFDLA